MDNELSVQNAIKQAGLEAGTFTPIPGYVGYVRTNLGVQPQGKETAPLAAYETLATDQPVQFPKYHAEGEAEKEAAQSIHEELAKRDESAKVVIVKNGGQQQVTSETLAATVAKASHRGGTTNLKYFDTYHLSEYELATVCLFSGLGKIPNDTFASSQRSLYLFKPNGNVYWLAVESGFSYKGFMGTKNLEGQVATLWTLIDGVPTLVDAYTNHEDIKSYFNKVMGKSKETYINRNEATKNAEATYRETYRQSAAQKLEARHEAVTHTKQASTNATNAGTRIGDLITRLGVEDASTATDDAQRYNAKLGYINGKASDAGQAAMEAATTLEDAINRNKPEQVIVALMKAADTSVETTKTVIAEVDKVFAERESEAARINTEAAERIQGNSDVYADLLKTAAAAKTQRTRSNGTNKLTSVDNGVNQNKNRESTQRKSRIFGGGAVRAHQADDSNKSVLENEEQAKVLSGQHFQYKKEADDDQKIAKNNPRVNGTLWAGTVLSFTSALLLCGEYYTGEASTGLDDTGFKIEGVEMPALIILATALVLVGVVCALKTDAGRTATQNMSFNVFSFGGNNTSVAPNTCTPENLPSSTR